MKGQCVFEKEVGVYKSNYIKTINYFDGEKITLSVVGSCPASFIERTGCNGDSIWRTYLPLSYGAANGIIINNVDSSVIVAGVDWGADDVQMPTIAKLIVLNKFGNLLKVIPFQADTIITSGISNPCYGFTSITISSTGSLFATLENHILKIDTVGNLLDVVNTGKTVNSILFDTLSQQLLTFSDDGILLYDTNLNLSSTVGSGTGYVKGFKNRTNYFLQTRFNTIEKADAALNLIDSIFVGGVIRDMELDDDKIYVFVKPSATHPYFATFDTSLILLDTFSIGRTDFNSNDFSVFAGAIHAVGSLNQHSQAFMYQQKFPDGSTSHFPFGSDIGITQLRLENPTQTYYATFGPTVVYKFNADCYATIKNFSSDTIHNYYISSPIYGGMNCMDFVYNYAQWRTIPPFDSIDVFVTHIYKELAANTYFNLCLFTVSPNFLPDINTSNDDACTQSFITSVPNILHSGNLYVSPNPFSTQLTFSLTDNEQTTVSLCNFLGQQVLQQAFTNSTTINTEQLADGIYFYELRSDKGTLKTGKLVKQ